MVKWLDGFYLLTTKLNNLLQKMNPLQVEMQKQPCENVMG